MHPKYIPYSTIKNHKYKEEFVVLNIINKLLPVSVAFLKTPTLKYGNIACGYNSPGKGDMLYKLGTNISILSIWS